MNHSCDISVTGKDIHCEDTELLGGLLGHVFQSMTDLRKFFPPPTNTAVNLMYSLLPKE